MVKTAFAALAAASAIAAPAAFAGPYVNVEANSSWTGSDYTGTNTDLHVGWEGDLGETASYYVQGGATVISPDKADADTVPSGKAGIGIGVTDALLLAILLAIWLLNGLLLILPIISFTLQRPRKKTLCCFLVISWLLS